MPYRFGIIRGSAYEGSFALIGALATRLRFGKIGAKGIVIGIDQANQPAWLAGLKHKLGDGVLRSDMQKARSLDPKLFVTPLVMRGCPCYSPRLR